MSPRSTETIKILLKKHYKNVNISVINNLTDLESLVEINPDLVIVGMKRLPLKDGSFIEISSYLEDRGIVITGSNSTAIELERNKTDAKDVVKNAGLATSNYIRADISKLLDISTTGLKFPMFIKPINRGSGLGIDSNSVVRNITEFNATIKSLSERNFTDIMIEDFLPGREYSIAILKEINSNYYSVMPLEMIAPKNKNGDRILGCNIKNNDTEKLEIIPAGEIKDEIITFAEDVFVALGARDYGRIDVRYNSKGELQFIEANLLPGLSDTISYFPKACMLNQGLDYESIILRIVNLAFSRNVENELESAINNLDLSLA
jgi:D-alanine-D-alanine ligase